MSSGASAVLGAEPEHIRVFLAPDTSAPWSLERCGSCYGQVLGRAGAGPGGDGAGYFVAGPCWLGRVFTSHRAGVSLVPVVGQLGMRHALSEGMGGGGVEVAGS